MPLLLAAFFEQADHGTEQIKAQIILKKNAPWGIPE